VLKDNSSDEDIVIVKKRSQNNPDGQQQQPRASGSRSKPTEPQPTRGNEEFFVRCTMCPSPGLILKTEKDHVRRHVNLLFRCKACEKMEIEYFDLRNHIVHQHKVRDEALIKESICLPSNAENLVSLVCGIPSCGETYIGQPRMVMEEHIATLHGKYFLQSGQGKNIQSKCRICLLRFNDSSSAVKHVQEKHKIPSSFKS